MLITNLLVGLAMNANVPSIADGGTIYNKTSKYKQNENKKQIFGR